MTYEQAGDHRPHCRKKRFDEERCGNGRERGAGRDHRSLRAGEKVQFVGFGTFETRKRSARTGRNPQTGETINIPEAVIPAFRAGNKLKEAVK